MLERMNLCEADFTDLNMHQYGMEDCRAGYSCGPLARNFYLLHFILSGKGMLQTGGKSYALSEGQGFLVCPDSVSFYRADSETPWSYAWVGFSGIQAETCLKSARLTSHNPIFHFSDREYIRNCFEKMIAARSLQNGRNTRLQGYLYLLLSQLLEEARPSGVSEQSSDFQALYVQKAIGYMKANYARRIRIRDIAAYVGINRSYLCLLCKSHLNMSPQSFLIRFRINKSCEFMKDSALNIGEISRLVGIEDPCVFSKTFRKIKGLSPKEYRKTFQSQTLMHPSL